MQILLFNICLHYICLHVYMEGHMASYINSTILADSTVVKALENSVEREEAWAKKSSTIVKCKQIFTEVGENIVLSENISSRRRAVKDIKKAANKHIAQEYLDKANQHANDMVVQGAFTTILAEEEKDVAWKSIIYQVPRGVMAFSLRAATNSLATPDNLARWGRVVDKSCNLCSQSPCTLGHVLNNCKKALDRFEWRHNNVLAHLYSTLRENKPDNVEIYADLEGAFIGSSTVPVEIMITSSRPDITIVDRRQEPATVLLVELTIHFTSGIQAAADRKRARYEFLSSDIKDAGFNCQTIPLEICSRGHINSRNRSSLANIFHSCQVKTYSKTIKNLSKLSLLGSYTVYNARRIDSWNITTLLKP